MGNDYQKVLKDLNRVHYLNKQIFNMISPLEQASLNDVSGNKTLNIFNKKYVKSLVENANPNIKRKKNPNILDIEDTSFENKPLVKLQTLDVQNKFSAISKKM